MFWNYVSGPLIGSVIGYCTNYLAVKMLFYPRKELRIGGHRLPFTPGVIPQGKPRLAAAIGEMVGKTLLTKEDIARRLLSPELETMAVDKMMNLLSGEIKPELLQLMNEETYEEKRQKITEILLKQVTGALEELPVGQVIAQEGQRIIKEKVQGTFLAMMINDELLASLIGPMSQEIQQYVTDHAADYVRPVLDKKTEELEHSSGLELLVTMDISREQMRESLAGLYRKLAKQGLEALLEKMDISQMVADKINDMDVLELEKLVLTVMKKELDTIVNLGAVIGFLLGILNIFF